MPLRMTPKSQLRRIRVEFLAPPDVEGYLQLPTAALFPAPVVGGAAYHFCRAASDRSPPGVLADSSSRLGMRGPHFGATRITRNADAYSVNREYEGSILPLFHRPRFLPPTLSPPVDFAAPSSRSRFFADIAAPSFTSRLFRRRPVAPCVPPRPTFPRPPFPAPAFFAPPPRPPHHRPATNPHHTAQPRFPRRHFPRPTFRARPTFPAQTLTAGRPTPPPHFPHPLPRKTKNGAKDQNARPCRNCRQTNIGRAR